MPLRDYIQAARLRTLPLSISGIIVGSAMAYSQGSFDSIIFILSILTTVGFQVLSNFANDYGDGVKGTDNEDRVGPVRAIQSGSISPRQMKNTIIITSCISMTIALYLLWYSFQDSLYNLFLFVGFAIASIIAAITYTVGKKAYGYSGFGDVFVFLFFGLLGVVGAYYLYTKEVHFLVFLPAITIGLLSTAVLNLNNLRDAVSDAKSNKNTLVVKMGVANGKRYHYLLLLCAFSVQLCYTILNHSNWKGYLSLIAFIPVFRNLVIVLKTKNTQDLDPELKKVALSTFLFALLFAIGVVL